jgi:single-strand DNA-binding protein
MSDQNSYNFTGRLGADAETKYTQGGTCITSFRAAVGYGYGDNKGTNWVTVKVFGKQAEALGKCDIAKGQQVAVTGELRISEFDRKDGTRGTSVEVNATNVSLIGGKPEGRSEAKPSPRREAPPAKSNDFGDDPADSDIPF